MIQKKVRVRVFISGDVVGVGFRAWILRQAQDKQLTGWVKNVNLPQRGVEAVFVGGKNEIERMIKLCWKGPEVSWVEKVDVEWSEGTGELMNFEVRY